MKIVVVGMGFVGISIAVLLAQYNSVVAVDIDSDKVNKINQRISPIQDKYVSRFFVEKNLLLTATTDSISAYSKADYVIIAVPTNYDDRGGELDTSIIDSIINQVIQLNKSAVIVIKSTVPIGYTKAAQMRAKSNTILFCPEFLRETFALYDNLYPSRIVVGVDMNDNHKVTSANTFISLLKESAIKENIATMLMGTTEAEAVKLFSNTYLALRVCFFNELDTYAEMLGLNTSHIISGVCLDPRIGMEYNNPSFGYGGYCLPKDTKQLLKCYTGIPQKIISAVVESNELRKQYITDRILEVVSYKARIESDFSTQGPIIGIFRLTMKSNSDNFRFAAILEIIDYLKNKGIKPIIYEPKLRDGSTYNDCLVVNDFEVFKRKSDIIIANRYDDMLSEVEEKLFSRDIFKRD